MFHTLLMRLQLSKRVKQIREVSFASAWAAKIDFTRYWWRQTETSEVARYSRSIQRNNGKWGPSENSHTQWYAIADHHIKMYT